ncbi:RCC1 domain-containing protein [Vibrio mediterranei]|uniref:RCC1 domain-containing protein n=1 Tax=Vibrio mediterranei TaxID=689 RepID=UPI00148B61B3|nr:hypothetical protein [Vibrio mediterranei]NOH29658.1 hypothetical protein [Vibrio mediterranei]
MNNFSKSVLTLYILASVPAFAASYVAIIKGDFSVKGEPTKNTERADPWSSWVDDGGHYGCGAWNPDESTIDWGTLFNQARDCNQDKERERDVYDVWSDGTETYNRTEYEFQTITEQESQQATGTKNYVDSQRADPWSSWDNQGASYDCSTWNPDESTIDYGTSFTQSRDCSQDQIRDRDIYDVWADGSETYSHTEFQNQTITEQESQQSTGTKNYITGTENGTWSNWTNTGITYNCSVWTPDPSTVDDGVSFTQNRDCSQDQTRTRTIYNVWADGSKTVKTTETDNQTINVTENQQAVGTKPVKVQFVKISGGYDHALALDAKGNVWVVGDNQYGQLGLGDTNHRYNWTKTNITNASDVHASRDYGYIVKNGQAFSAGLNSDGQLGLGHTTNRTTFTATGFSGFTQIELGSDFAYAIKNGKLYVLGNNGFGQLGLGNNNDKSNWTATSYSVTDVAAGGSFGQVLIGGKVYSTGWSMQGGLGLGSTTSVNSFAATNLSGVTNIEAMANSSYAVKNGQIYATGKNYSGQLGLGHTNDVSTFTATGVSGFTQLEAKGDSGYMIKNGDLYVVGSSWAGQLGFGDMSDKHSWTMTHSNVDVLGTGDSFNYIIDSSGNLKSTGYNNRGQLGQGDTTERHNWTKIQDMHYP